MERKRILWAALLLLLIGGGLLAYRRLSPSQKEAPPPVVFSADNSGRMSSLLHRFATLFGRGSGRSITVAEMRKALSSASDDPMARPFAEQFMRDPVLRKIWEKHRDGDEARGFAEEVAETPEFRKLLEQWQQTPDFVALAERVAGSAEGDAAQRSARSDRMLLTGAQPAPPTAPVLPAPALPAPGRAASSAHSLARFKSIFSLMERAPRERVLAEMEKGYSARASCGRAKAVEACDEAFKLCQAEADCARWLAQDEERGNGLSDNAGQFAKKDKKEVVVLRADGPAGDGGPGTDAEPAEDQPDRPTGSGGGSRPPAPRKPPPAAKPTPPPPPKPTSTPRCQDPRCFVAGTRVLTPAGGIPIETLRPGDRVLAADLQTGELVATEVLETFRSEAKGLRRLTFSNGLELRVTAEHPFFDPDTGGFRRARELALGDRVGRLSRRGGALDAFPLGFGGGPRLPPPARTFEFAAPAARFLEALTLIGIEELPSENVPVYNFHVGERQNYFAEGVLVHNRKTCD